MKPYIITSAILTDYEGRTLHTGELRDISGGPLITRRPPIFVEDEIIAQFNNAFPGRLFTNAKLITKQII